MQPAPVDPGSLLRLRRLVHLYAHSRILPLVFPLAVLVLNTGLIFSVGPLLDAIDEPPRVAWCISTLCMLVVLLTTVLAGYLTYKYGPRLYAGEGMVKLPSDYGNVCCWLLYMVTFLGPIILQPEYLTPRQAVAICLCSYGTFILYLGRKDERISGACFGGLNLLAGIGFMLGLPLPLAGEHGFFLTLMGTIVLAGLVSLVVVHAFNRAVLRGIRGMRIDGIAEDTADPDA